MDSRSALQGLEPRLPFSSIIIVEPMLSPDGRHHLERLRKALVKSAKERRHVWPDREYARQYLEERMKLPGRQIWDSRVIDLFVVRPLVFRQQKRLKILRAEVWPQTASKRYHSRVLSRRGRSKLKGVQLLILGFAY